MPAELAIRSLRARTPARAQPVAARLALQALSADLEDALPRGLPPQALLWLRRLALQAPEAELLRPAQPAWRQDWIAAGRRQFDAALAQAARPALGQVPESAPAVLFADAAEMLACLALAARSGQLDRWWWRGLLGRAWPQWPTAWAARPEAQPGAWRLLARSGQGDSLARWMAPLVPSLPWPAAPTIDEPSAAPVVTRPTAPAARDSAADGATSRSAGEAPSRRILACDAPAAGGGQSLSSKAQGSAPLPMRSRGQEVQAVLTPRAEGPAHDEPAGAPAHVGPARAAEDVETGVELAALASPPGVPPAARRAVQPRPRAEIQEAAPASAAAEAISPPSMPAGEAVPLPLVAKAHSMPSVALPPVNAPASPQPKPRVEAHATVAGVEAAARPAAPSELALPAWPWPQALATRQAPLLFIVNALLEDGLYPDFTRPRDPGLPVPLWALLAALASAWRLAPGEVLQQALAERCPGWTWPLAMPAAPGAAAGPWAPWLVAYARSLRRRLCRRLEWRASAWPRMLTLAQPARLWLSEAEWVAEFDLAAHDVAWRLAGLDRDPGWLPSAGCTLRFRFV